MSAADTSTDRIEPDRTSLARSLRHLAKEAHQAELSPALIGDLVAGVDALARRVDLESDGRRGPWWERGPDYHAAYEADSAFRGRENPWSPQMRVERSGPVGVGATATAVLTLDHRWTGPPKAVHGGVLAGLFDELIGVAASHAEPTAFLVTGRLAMRYREPTPIGALISLTAEVTAASTRSLKVHATSTVNERITATADALMVVRRQRRQTKRL